MNILWSKISMFRSSLKHFKFKPIWCAQVMTTFYGALFYLGAWDSVPLWIHSMSGEDILQNPSVFHDKKSHMSLKQNEHGSHVCVFIYLFFTLSHWHLLEKYIIVFRPCVGCFNLLIWTYSVYLLIYKIKYVKYVHIILKYV